MNMSMLSPYKAVMYNPTTFFVGWHLVIKWVSKICSKIGKYSNYVEHCSTFSATLMAHTFYRLFFHSQYYLWSFYAGQNVSDSQVKYNRMFSILQDLQFCRATRLVD